jgi:hypothetical protein
MDHGVGAVDRRSQAGQEKEQMQPGVTGDLILSIVVVDEVNVVVWVGVSSEWVSAGTV